MGTYSDTFWVKYKISRCHKQAFLEFIELFTRWPGDVTLANGRGHLLTAEQQPISTKSGDRINELGVRLRVLATTCWRGDLLTSRKLQIALLVSI